MCSDRREHLRYHQRNWRGTQMELIRCCNWKLRCDASAFNEMCKTEKFCGEGVFFIYASIALGSLLVFFRLIPKCGHEHMDPAVWDEDGHDSPPGRSTHDVLTRVGWEHRNHDEIFITRLSSYLSWLFMSLIRSMRTLHSCDTCLNWAPSFQNRKYGVGSREQSSTRRQRLRVFVLMNEGRGRCSFQDQNVPFEGPFYTDVAFIVEFICRCITQGSLNCQS